MRNDKVKRPSEMPRSADEPSSFQPPPGYEIGGNARGPHHPSDVLPVVTRGGAEPSEFQPPLGQIDADGDLPMGECTQGMTDNVLGDASSADVLAGCVEESTANPSMASLNPSLVNAGDPILKPGFLGRSNGWER